MKEKSKKQLDVKDITASPYFVAVLLGICIVLAVVVVVYFVMGIEETKAEITETRKIYAASVQEVDMLEGLKRKSEQAEAQIEEYEGLLPQAVGDVYHLQTKVITTFENFGLEVGSISFASVMNETSETVFTVSCAGSFSNIYDVINYYTNLEQIHRIDTLSLTKDSGSDKYTATITLAILSENAAEGVVASADESTAA